MITQNVKTRKIGFCFKKSTWTERVVPHLRLEGVWMEKIGLEIGGKVQIIASEGRIIIEKL